MKENPNNNSPDQDRSNLKSTPNSGVKPFFLPFKDRLSTSEVLIFLLAIVATHYLDRDITTTIILCIAFFFYHFSRSFRSKIPRYSLFVVSVVFSVYAVTRFYQAASSVTPKQQITQQIDSTDIRPRLVLQLINIRKLIVGQRLEIEIPYSNLGKLTAYNIEHKHGLKTGGTGIYEKEWNLVKSSNDDVRSLLEPSTQASFIIWSDYVITLKDSAGIMDGTRRLFVFGIITYTDELRKHQYHRKYCMKFDPSMNLFADYADCNDAN